MKTFVLSLSSALMITGALVACSSPAPTTADKKDSNLTKSGDTDKDSDKDKGSDKGTTATAPPPAAAQSTTTTTGTGTGTAPAPGEAEAMACMTQCLGADAKAKSLFQTYDGCMQKCAETDEQCFGKCDDAMGQACQSAAAACDKMDECGAKCFPDDGGGQGGATQP